MYNRIVLIGRLVRDPEYRSTPDGVTLARMRIAVDRPRNPRTGEKETDFIDLVAWRSQAEFAINYLKKGRLILTEGRLHTRDWVSPQGERHRGFEVVVDRIVPLERAREGEYTEEETVPSVTPASQERFATSPRVAVDDEKLDPFTDVEDVMESDFAADYDPFADNDEE